MTNELLVPVLRRRCAAAVAMHVSMLLLVGLVKEREVNGWCLDGRGPPP